MTNINEIIQYLQQWITAQALRQIAAFVLVLILAYIPAKLIEWILKRTLTKWHERLPWLDNALKILTSLLYPLFAGGLGYVALRLFEIQGWASDILAWLLPLVVVWLVYRLAVAAVRVGLPPEQVRRVHLRIIIPLTLVLVGLHIAGVLTNLWQDPTGILQALILVLIFFLAKIPVEPIRRWLDKVQMRVLQSSIMEILPVARDVIPTLMSALQPLIAWILGMVAIGIYDVLGADRELLVWAVPLFLLWFVFEAADAFVTMRTSPQKAKRSHRALQILALVIAVLHTVGRLETVWEWGLWQIGGNAYLQFGGLLTGLLILLVALLLSRTTRVFLRQRLPDAGLDPSLTQILATVAGYTVVLFGLLIAFNRMNIPLTSFTVILGGLSVGLGFSLQDILSNFISGLVLMFERSIAPGDVLQVDEITGVVQEVGIRATRMRSYDNVEIIVPNSRFLTQEVTNYSTGDRKVRIHLPIGVTSDADPRQTEAAILKAAHHPDLLDDPAPSVFYVDFTGDNHDFELLVWTDDATKAPRIKSDLRYGVWYELAAADIGLPIQELDLHVRSIPPEMRTDGSVTEAGQKGT